MNRRWKFTTWAAAMAGVVAATVAMAQIQDARVQELMKLRFGMFICWSFSTFSGTEWTPGVKDVSFFRATEVDTEQWVRTAKEAGMGYILFLTKHHDGFCLWDTKTTERKVTRAPLGRDVLAELRQACDRHGMRLALYFSEGDWTWPGAEDGKAKKGGSNPAMKRAQLRELLTGYGPIEYIWFDHAIGDGGLSHAETAAFVKSLQPDCFVGFNHGDQEGVDIRLGELGRPGTLEDIASAGPYMTKTGSRSYRLAEFTYPILPPHQGGAMWFYSLPQHDSLVHPAERIYTDYAGAVKYGNVFSLAVAPDYRGKLRKVDVTTLQEVGRRIRGASSATPPPGAAAKAVVPNFAEWVQPVPLTARMVDPDHYIWCGSMVRGDDGKYHLYYSRWLRKLGFNAWVTHSEIAHAVGESPAGPFRHSDVVLPARGKEFWDGLCTHNPTVLRTGGKYYLYYMGNTGDGKVMKELNWDHRNHQRIGVAVADSPRGPWKRFDKPLVDVSQDPGAPDALVANNPAVTERPDGGFLMVYKAVGKQRPMPFGGPVVHLTATSDSPTGPFVKQLRPVFVAPGVDFAAEDPFIWYDKSSGRYLAIVKDNAGHFTQAGRSLSLWESNDGFNWKLAEHPLVSKTEITWTDGRHEDLRALERPQLLFASDGSPSALLAAVAPQTGDLTYNVVIPLRRPSGAKR